MLESKQDIMERIRARKHRQRILKDIHIGKIEVNGRLWKEILDAAQDSGYDVRNCKGIWLSVMDFELDDPPGPEPVELAEEEHCGGG